MISKKALQDFSLRENCRLRILEDMLKALKETNPYISNYILVVDDVTTRIVSSTLKMIDLLEAGVLGPEKLELSRKPFPKMHAIYFITPTEQSIEKLCDDFKDAKNPTYGNVHVFLTNHVEKSIMDILTKKPNLLARLLTFKEINLDFLCPEENVFHFDLPHALPIVYSKYDLKEERNLSDLIADKLATVVPCLFDYKNIHIIYNKNNNNSVAEKVAKRVYQRLEKFLQVKQDNEGDQNLPSVKIIILDRSFDPLTPALHDCYYQAMCYDLLKIENDVVEYESTDNVGKKTKNKTMLSDADDLWNKYKHKHIADAMQGVTQEFEAFVANNETTKAQKDFSKIDLKAVSEIVKSMPLYNELMTKYTLHMSLLEQCLQGFTTRGIKEIGEIEQCLATALDSQGKSVSNQRILAMIVQKIAMGKIEAEEKLRLIFIAAIALELADKDLKILTQHLPTEDQLLITKLAWLGIDHQKINASKGKPRDQLFDMCRHTASIENIAKDVISQKYDKSQFGSLYLPKEYDGSLGRKIQINALNITRNANKQSDQTPREKLIFFVIGGISYTELRVLKEFECSSANIDVISGGTAIMSPMDYIQGVRKMVSTSEYSKLKAEDTL